MHAFMRAVFHARPFHVPFLKLDLLHDLDAPRVGARYRAEFATRPRSHAGCPLQRSIAARSLNLTIVSRVVASWVGDASQGDKSRCSGRRPCPSRAPKPNGLPVGQGRMAAKRPHPPQRPSRHCEFRCKSLIQHGVSRPGSRLAARIVQREGMTIQAPRGVTPQDSSSAITLSEEDDSGA
jgi:hypothetical protein